MHGGELCHCPPPEHHSRCDQVLVIDNGEVVEQGRTRSCSSGAVSTTTCMSANSRGWLYSSIIGNKRRVIDAKPGDSSLGHSAAHRRHLCRDLIGLRLAGKREMAR